MAITTRKSITSSSNNSTKPYVLHIGEDSIYGIIINARDVVSLRTKDGTMKKFDMNPELLLRILKNGITNITILEDTDNSGSQSDLPFN